MKKRFLGIFLCLVAEFNCEIPALAQEVSVQQEIKDIDNYMQNVINFTHNPFSADNLLETNSLAETYSLRNQRHVTENKELAINEYYIENCEQVFCINDDFLSKLRNGVISLNKNKYSWYLPVENGEGKQSLLEFKERNNILSAASLSISQYEHEFGFLTDAEIKNILEENGIEYTGIEYFSMPTFYGAAVCVNIETNSGENYVMVVDNSLNEDSFEVGYVYSTSELYDIFAN